LGLLRRSHPVGREGPRDQGSGQPQALPAVQATSEFCYPRSPFGASRSASRTGGYGVVWFRTVAGLWCQECLLLADDPAREWRLLRVDVPGEDDEPILAAYCPACAEREFGLSRRTDSAQTDSSRGAPRSGLVRGQTPGSRAQGDPESRGYARSRPISRAARARFHRRVWPRRLTYLWPSRGRSTGVGARI
jgi:hypothetical protein